MINRRHFLRSSICTLVLPNMLSMPGYSQSQSERIKRSLVIGTELGLHPDSFFPKAFGEGYEMSDLLKPLESFRQQMTIFSNVDHPNLGNGHNTTHAWLSGVSANMSAGYSEGNITVDQKIAKEIGYKTRYPSLQVGIGGELSWNKNGVLLNPQNNLKELFHHLFSDGQKGSIEKQKHLMRENKSLLDSLYSESRLLSKTLDYEDRQKLEQYMTSVRELESKIQQQESWLTTPKPKVKMSIPDSTLDITTHMPLTYELIALAFETDSTRSISYSLGQTAPINNIPGVSKAYHDLSHHGKDPAKLGQLLAIESFYMRQLAKFLHKLNAIQGSENNSLLNDTQILVGSGMSNASSHSCRNLPTLIIGGDLKHGCHHDASLLKKNRPLCDVFVSYLRGMGLSLDQFGSSRGDVDALLLKST